MFANVSSDRRSTPTSRGTKWDLAAALGHKNYAWLNNDPEWRF